MQDSIHPQRISSIVTLSATALAFSPPATRIVQFVDSKTAGLKVYFVEFGSEADRITASSGTPPRGLEVWSEFQESTLLGPTEASDAVETAYVNAFQTNLL
jgi:hypothetical protein